MKYKYFAQSSFWEIHVTKIMLVFGKWKENFKRPLILLMKFLVCSLFCYCYFYYFHLDLHIVLKFSIKLRKGVSNSNGCTLPCHGRNTAFPLICAVNKAFVLIVPWPFQEYDGVVNETYQISSKKESLVYMLFPWKRSISYLSSEKNYSSLAIAGSHLMHASNSVIEGTIKCQKFSKHFLKLYQPINNIYSFLRHNSVTKWIFSAEPQRNIHSWCNTVLTWMVANWFRNIFWTDFFKGKTDSYFMTIIDQFWKSYQ